MDDPRHAPLYSIPECARYLGLPVSSVRSWIAAPGSEITSNSRRLVTPAGSDPTALSFTNLVEIFALCSLRRHRQAPTRELLDIVLCQKRDDESWEHNVSPKAAFCLKRIECDSRGVPIRFYPFTRGFGREDPKMVVIDPAVKFGRPVISGTGVTTGAIAKFVKAGEPLLELAEDYRVELPKIEEAVRYELAG